MYVRNLRKPSATKNVYKFASSKNRSVILCESSLERDCCDHLEYSKDVVSFQSQPEGFYYSSGNKLCPYTPDFLVRNLDGSEYFLEVKPLNKTFPEDFKKAFASTRIAAQKLGKPVEPSLLAHDDIASFAVGSEMGIGEQLNIGLEYAEPMRDRDKHSGGIYRIARKTSPFRAR
ncbi:Tn7 transposase TnsA N-terminal domain-containing protein [Vibrio cincinnatiensis]|uniref:Tn7 transposase TnsA N-terminal domain-containing protein n=1 Tax=Vibrio cincinnatiensis TaxID=675 RepID=UPI001EDF6D9E|nr:Tn7 transposase TnsA N-terminal domain-containing protein [Vibrio cincinnatiensis]